MSLHAQRVASRGLLNRDQIRKMSQDPDLRVQRLADVLVRKHSAVQSDKLDDIERRRQQIASGVEASQYGMTKQRMTDLALVASKGPRWATLIFDIVMALRPARVLEMGTAVGVSGAYIAAALEASDVGELVTIEYNSKSYEVAQDTFSNLGLEQRVTAVLGTFEASLEPLMGSEPRFELVFKDGEHSESATNRWFESLASRLAPSAAFLLDDIRRDAGMKNAWDHLRIRPEVAASIDFFGMGLLLLAASDEGSVRSYRFGIR